MVLDAVHDTGVHIAGGADLERDAPISQEVTQPSEFNVAVGRNVPVLDDPDAVSKAFGAAILHGLPDRSGPVGLAGVDRDVEVLPVAVLEREEVIVRREAVLGSGDVEADYAVVSVPYRGLGNLETAVEVAHR